MNLLVFLVALISASVVGCSANANSAVSEQFEQMESESLGGQEPVLVELFTSEGCSSCPPADRTLAFLKSNQPVRGAEVIALGYHVDYWDHLGWKDPFSSPEFSRRQEFYVRAFGLGSSYTPQMVVDGHTEFVGSNMERAAKAIGESVAVKKGTVAFSKKAGELGIDITLIGAHSGANVILAVAEDGLETDVKRGENGGKKLSHISVVRSLHTLGTIDSKKESSSFNFKIDADDAKPESRRYFVVFVQDDNTKRVLAVGKSQDR
jgi:hypothetical protein